MITKKRYEMLVDAHKKGAALGPRDFAAIDEYRQAHATLKWIKKKRTATSLNDDTDNPINIPEQIYEELELADGCFRLRIHNDNERPGVFYPYLVRMSGPLSFDTAEIVGNDKEGVKNLSLLYLKEKFTQALREIEELEN